MTKDKDRPAFEAFMSDSGKYPQAIERNSNEDYLLMTAASSWHVWQAAIAHDRQQRGESVAWPIQEFAIIIDRSYEGEGLSLAMWNGENYQMSDGDCFNRDPDDTLDGYTVEWLTHHQLEGRLTPQPATPPVKESLITAEPVNERCPYCDDTGDVHSIDGEWRGACVCPAGLALSAEPVRGGPIGWRDFIENIATPRSEPLNSVSGYSDKASRKAAMGALRMQAAELLRVAPQPADQAQQDADKLDAVSEMVHAMFRSGNDVPVERATITRERMIEIIEEWNLRAKLAGQVDKSSNQQSYQVDKTPEKQDQSADPDNPGTSPLSGNGPFKTVDELMASIYAEPVSVPSDGELLDWAEQEQFFLFCDEDEFLDIARALLAKYGQ